MPNWYSPVYLEGDPMPEDYDEGNLHRPALRTPLAGLIEQDGAFIDVQKKIVKDPAYFRSYRSGYYAMTVVSTGRMEYLPAPRPSLNQPEIRKELSRRLWMSDSPQEIMMMKMDAESLLHPSKPRSVMSKWTPEELKEMNVLVLGLGLGVFPQLIEEKVRSITVVEINPLVIRAVWPHVKSKDWNIVCGDAWKIVQMFGRNSGQYDLCYMDIWEDISEDNKEQYMELKALARKVGCRRTVGWVEDHVYGRANYFGSR